jgi:hypothetical protein
MMQGTGMPVPYLDFSEMCAILIMKPIKLKNDARFRAKPGRARRSIFIGFFFYPPSLLGYKSKKLVTSYGGLLIT